MSRPVDFDTKFQKYAERWMQSQLAKGRKPEQLEDEVPELYMRFINQKADWLDGLSPAEYFARYNNAAELIEMLLAYENSNVSVPDLLLERITDLGKEAVKPLLKLAGDEAQSRSVRVTAVNLLIELDSRDALGLCVSLVNDRTKDDELADAAADLLRNMGKAAIDPMLEALPDASDAAAETFLDLLCNFPGLPRVYEETERRFLTESDHRALYASFLAKLGDPRAIDALIKVSELQDINYLDYIEIRDAVEELGGTLPTERDFNGDPYYESMRKL